MHVRLRRLTAPALAAALLLAAGCAQHAAAPPRGVIVNRSAVELQDVSFIGSRGLLAPTVDRLAPGDSAADTLGVRSEDAVFVSFLAAGRARVSVDSAWVAGRGDYQVRFVVDSALTARAAGGRLRR